MLFDVVQEYTPEEKEVLRDLRKSTLTQLARDHDHKKIISFLTKAGVIGIDEKEHIISIGVPNEFLLTQIKKFFHKSLQKTVRTIYNPQYNVRYHMYPPFQQKNNDLQINVQKLFGSAMVKEEKKTYNNNDNSLHIAHEFGVTLTPAFSFDTIVTSSNNNFAISAAKAVAENPGTIYNPLFIYGGVGLGKTHALQAVGHHILANDKNKVVVFMPATTLIDAIVEAIRKNKLNSLKNKLLKADVLLIDDVQFLANKEKTQEVFLTIFNDFAAQNKQIVLTSDQPPKELANIEARLKSRFSKGLVVDIQAPDYETRIAILQNKLRQKGEDIDFDLLSIVAKNITSNVRELEGALNIILTRKQLTHTDIDENAMYNCLSTLGYNVHGEEQATIEDITQVNTRSVMSFSKIVEFVSTYYNISINDLKSPKRSKDISQARQMLMVIAKNHFNRTLEKIGDYFGGKNHATVIYALNNFNRKVKNNKTLSHDYNVIMEQVGH